MISAVIFDMDGLMTDTERLFIDMWCQIMRERGLPERDDVVKYCIGQAHDLTEQYVAQELGQDFDYVSVLKEINRRSLKYFEEVGVPVKSGLHELMNYLRKENIPCAVATSTKSEYAKSRLRGAGALDYIQVLITGDMVEHGKPDPEIYLKAAAALDVPPESCLVLEDSPHGIEAAYRAGCIPVMIPDLREPDDRTKAMLFDLKESLAEIPALIEENR